MNHPHHVSLLFINYFFYFAQFFNYDNRKYDVSHISLEALKPPLLLPLGYSSSNNNLWSSSCISSSTGSSSSSSSSSSSRNMNGNYMGVSFPLKTSSSSNHQQAQCKPTQVFSCTVDQNSIHCKLTSKCIINVCLNLSSY